MSLVLWSLIVATGFVYLSKVPMNVATLREEAYDNHLPREQQLRLTGWGLRARAAHQNMLESYPMFAAGALVAEFAASPTVWISATCLVYLISRLCFQVFYLIDQPFLRSFSWGISYLCILLLLGSPVLS